MLYSNCATCTLAQRCIATVLTSFSYVADVQRRDAIGSSHGHNNKHTWLHNDIATLRSIYCGCVDVPCGYGCGTRAWFGMMMWFVCCVRVRYVMVAVRALSS